VIAPELVAQRLAGVQEALDLGRSLAGARGAPLPFATFEARSLCVTGRLGAGAVERARRCLAPGQPAANEVCLAVSLAGAEHHLGAEFDVIVPVAGARESGTRAVLVGVTLEWGKARSESVPRGHRSLCVLQFPGGVPEEIRALPEVEDWGAPIVAWIGTRANLDRVR
jgi:hypothetical protein